QTDDDGTGPAGRGDAQRFGGELAGAVLVVDGDHAFRGRGETLGQAELLGGFARPVRGRPEADEEDERRRVLPGGVDGDHRIRRTRTARNHGDARTPGQPGLGQGHEPGTALLTADDRVDGGVVESVEDVEVALTGHRVDPFD